MIFSLLLQIAGAIFWFLGGIYISLGLEISGKGPSGEPLKTLIRYKKIRAWCIWIINGYWRFSEWLKKSLHCLYFRYPPCGGCKSIEQQITPAEEGSFYFTWGGILSFLGLILIIIGLLIN